ncbi:MAG: sugar phosphate isomerase/epimerase [Clostridia bacterium]|nr:sugar phosphate isomerase/epimerase [Clostridia bacterium]
MKNFKLGVILESFKLPLREAAVSAEKIGADGVQIFVNSEGFAPVDTITKEGKSELLNVLGASGLAISALCADFGMGFGHREKNPELIERSKRAVDLALELGTNIITTHIGVVPGDSAHERYKVMQEACAELAAYADSVGARFAVETGPETSLTLKNFLDSLGSRGVSVNLDPANLVMVTGDDPVQAVYNLRDYIVHTHAKDGIKLMDVNPEFIYRVTHPLPADFEKLEAFRELPLGQGSVPFAEYLAALKDIGYSGYLTIEREVGDNPAADIRLAANYLSSL